MNSNIPLFQSVLGQSWQALPPVMQKHYGVRAGSGDRVTVEGVMDIERSRLARILSPFLQFFGALVPYSGKNIPTIVQFYSLPNTHAFVFDRVFSLQPNCSYRFRSQLEPVRGNEVIEFMRFGIGWRARYSWDGKRVLLQHAGYVWRVFNLLIPVPLGWIIGKGDAWEEPLSDDSFRMWMGVVHPYFGQVYSYAGTFRVTEVRHG